MNLRELVGDLEREKPQASEAPVMVRGEDGLIYTIVRMEYEPEVSVEGQPDGLGGTVWLRVVEL